MKKGSILLGCVGLVLLLLVGFAIWAVGVRNNLVMLEENVNSQWSQVENVYQRRFDLIPNLVRTVQGAADFERETLQNVIEARSRVGQVSQAAPTAEVTTNPQAFQQFAQAQESLGGALSRLLVVVERYPELRANQNFLTLQSQLEGTENRIAVERRRYNEVARDFNTAVRKFPANVIAGMTGFQQKQYFQSTAGADQAPQVDFDFSRQN